MKIFGRLIAKLLHLANSDPPFSKQEFYSVKERLLQKHGRFRGHEIQEIRKECWGDGWWRYDDGPTTPCGPKCKRCGGTGVFDLRWVRLERWEWRGYVFHRPAGDTRIRPESVQIHGLIEHRDYGRMPNEAALWLYLLVGEWRLLWRSLRSSCCCGRYLWPMLNVQRIAFWLSRKLKWRRCWCGRRFPTLGKGWMICGKCRRKPADIPF